MRWLSMLIARKMHGLTDTHPGAVHGAENDVVRKGGSRLEKPQDFARAKNHRQMVFLAGCRKHFDEAIPLQRDAIEKT